MSKTFMRHVFCIFTAFALLLSIFSFFSSASNPREELQREIERLENQIDENNGKISRHKASADELREQIDAMQKQLGLYGAQAAELNRQIAEKDALIADYRARIDFLQAELDSADAQIAEREACIAGTKELLGRRLRSAYMAGETSALEVLLSSKDYESYLMRLELLSRAAEHDHALMKDLQEKIDGLNVLKARLDRDRAEQQEKRTAAEAERAEIEKARSEVRSLYDTLDRKQSNLEAQMKSLDRLISRLDKNSREYKRQIKAAQDAMDEYDRQKAGEMEHGSGGRISMVRPLQYPNAYVSQHYGHYNGDRLHRGVDLCTRGTGSTMGKEIRAAADGVVKSAEYHWSWGNNVYVNHGDGIYTRYAHCSRMIVRPGDRVAAGQVIAYVGSTGHSTGPHLHFEVWVNGERVNPEPWIPYYPD